MNAKGLIQALLSVLLTWAGTGNAAALPAQRAADNFAANCAACHGPAGQPDPESPMVKALGIVPANFSDALFSSREPSSKFFNVIKYGGPSMGRSDKMPAFGGVFSDDEIEELIDYVKSLAGQHDFPSGDLNMFLPLKTRKAFPEDELVWKGRFEEAGPDEVFTQTLELERRFGTRSQLILELTHLVENSDGRFESVEFGAKHVLRYDRSAGFIATLGGMVAVPVDDSSAELVPFLAVGKRLGEQWTLQGSLRAKVPVENASDGLMEVSGIVHWVHTRSWRAVFPALEFTGEFPFDRGTGVDRVAFSRWTVTPQMRIGLTKGGHVALNLGVEVPINETDRFDWRGMAYLIWDFADGSLFSGW